ncbi:MAG: DUF5684 domain-containing protein [Candidatus Dojkabacteria bacterium]|jgi:hypothetical protein|nr:DUF5684 domain-containing protein [Candidatus Dojkabacteria bacterium]
MSKTKLLLVSLLAILLLPLGVISAQEDAMPIEDPEQIPQEYEIVPDDDYDYDYEFSWDDDAELQLEDLMYTTTMDSTDEEGVLAGLLGAGIASLFAGVYLLVVSAIGIGSYIFSSLALMKIGKELGYENAWFAWIPILSSVMMFQLGGQNPWLLLLLLIPGLGAFIVAILSIIALAEITAKRGYEKVLVLLILIPFGMYVVLYLLAWKPKSVVEKKVTETVTTTPTA